MMLFCHRVLLLPANFIMGQFLSTCFFQACLWFTVYAISCKSGNHPLIPQTKGSHIISFSYCFNLFLVLIHHENLIWTPTVFRRTETSLSYILSDSGSLFFITSLKLPIIICRFVGRWIVRPRAICRTKYQRYQRLIWLSSVAEPFQVV